MIIRWSYKAQKQQDLGKVEPLLVHRKKVYRSIVLTKKNKLVYTIDKDCICVHALWDTRREPKAQASRLK